MKFITLASFLFFYTLSLAQDISHKEFSLTEKKFRKNSRIDSTFKKIRVATLELADLYQYIEKSRQRNFRLKLDDTLYWDIELSPADITYSDFTLHLSTNTGSQTVKPSVNGFYTAKIKGETKGQSTFSIHKNYIRATLLKEGQEYFIEPLANYSKDASENEIIIYKTEDVLMPQITVCGNKNTSSTTNSIHGSARVNSSPDTSKICYTIPLILMTDYLMYEQFNFNIDSLVRFLLENVNMANTIYSGFNFNPLNNNTDSGNSQIQFKVKSIYMSNCFSCDYISKQNEATNLLREFNQSLRRDFVIPNFFMVGFWTTRNINIIGTNILGAASGYGGYGISPCNRFGSALLRYIDNLPLMRFLFAHEMGHNLGCQHDNEYNPVVNQFIMNSTPLNRAVKRFSIFSDFGGGTFSSAERVRMIILWEQNCMQNCNAAIPPCPAPTGIRKKELLISADSVTMEWNETGNFLVRLIQLKKSGQSVISETPVTGNRVVLKQIIPCNKYTVEVIPVCNTVNGTGISYSFQAEPYQLKKYDFKKYYSFYDLQMEFNGALRPASTLVFLDNTETKYTVDERTNSIIIKQLYGDNRKHKVELKDSSATGNCYLQFHYWAPDARANAVTLLEADFNDCKLPLNWKDSTVRMIRFSPPDDFIRWRATPFSPKGLITIVGTIDSTCMLYYEVGSPINGGAGELQLISPTKDISGYKNILLGFDYEMDAYKNANKLTDPFLSVDVFNGVNWVSVFERKADSVRKGPAFLRSIWDTLPPRVFIPLDQYRSEKFQIRFRVNDGWFLDSANKMVTARFLAAFDNIKISGYPIKKGISNEFSIYPNPTTGLINITVNTALFMGMKFKITDIAGKVLLSGNLNGNSLTLPPVLQTGIYFLQLYRGTSQWGETKKILYTK